MGACTSCSRRHPKTTPIPTPTPESQDSERAVKSTRSKFHANLQDLGTTPRHVRPQKRQRTVARDLPVCSLEVADALVTDSPKSNFTLEALMQALARHPVLSQLAEDAQDQVIDRMKHFQLKANTTVFEEGNFATHFFVVASGRLEVRHAGAVVRTLHPGDGFGELALLYTTKRTATVVTLDKTDLWGLDRNSFRDAVQSVNIHNYQENLAFIESVALFQELSREQREALLNSLTLNKFQPGDKIVVEGEPGLLFYIIKEGTVSCSVKGIEQRQLGKGDFFGEQALLYNTQRTATCVAVDTVKTFSLGQEQLQQVLGQSLQQSIYRNTLRMALDSNPTLSQLTYEQKEKLLDKFKVSTYGKGSVIAQAESPGVWVVLKGEAYSEGQKVARTTECFGDCGEVVSADISTKEECDIAHISREVLQTTLGGKLEAVLASNEGLSVLKRVQLFSGFSTQRLSLLFSMLRVRHFTDGQAIVQQADAGTSFFLVKEGQVAILRDGEVLRRIGKQDYFGERAILFSEARTASVVADGPVVCWELLKEDFDRVADSAVRTHLISRISLQDVNVALSSLRPVKLLGKGTFGHVILTVDPASKMLFALKSVSRAKVRAYALAESLRQERELLLRLDHSMIMKLVRTGKDPERVFFLMEYVSGEDLFDAIRSLGLLREADARFYSGCLVLILEHLHERGIVYRDLKPENIIISESVLSTQGYPKLIDFGTAKILNENRTFTIVGTPHYTAPEVITGRGYSLAVDYWSLGVMLFEFVYGTVPFGDGEEDPYAVYETVLKSPLVFPSVGVGAAAQSLISTLLSRNPSARSLGGIEKLKANRWFHSFDWEKLNLGVIRAPFLPKVKNLSKEVKEALRSKASVEDFCRTLEKDEDLPENTEISENTEVPGWDSAF